MKNAAMPETNQGKSQPVLTAAENLAWRRAQGLLKEFPAPKTIIFAPQGSLAKHALRRHRAKRITGFHGDFHLFNKTEIGLSSNFGIGAPVIAALTDEFGALGVVQFVLIGLAGGLQANLSAGSLVVSTSALRGEGVSRHYLPASETVSASIDLVRGISTVLDNQGVVYASGPTWTTDAPYREERQLVLKHQHDNLLAVDMEAAALLAVADSLGLSAVALYSIADTLSDGRWQMCADMRLPEKGLVRLFESVFEHLTS